MSWLWSAAPASAHLAILLVVTSPQPGQHVGSNVDVKVFAQRALAGRDTTSFTATLDGTALDPRTGRADGQPAATMIHVGMTDTIPLRHLAPGDHELVLTYKPDIDFPVQHPKTDFVVSTSSPSQSGSDVLLVLGLFAVGAVVAAVAAIVVVRIRRRSRV